jgi:hypothetical protein
VHLPHLTPLQFTPMVVRAGSIDGFIANAGLITKKDQRMAAASGLTNSSHLEDWVK